MTDELTIRCPKCKAPIRLTEAMAAPVLEKAKADYDRSLALETQRVKDAADRETEVRLATARVEFKKLKRQMEEQDAKLADAQKAQAMALTKERALAEKERELDLIVERRVNEGQAQVRLSMQRSIEAEMTLKVTERDQTIDALKRHIDELKQRAEQGNTRDQGEAQEIALEQMLRATFRYDTIQSVSKGVFGGDVLHGINSPGPIGCIIWESKRTKSWSGEWLPKLRNDQRAAHADVAILVTQTMPKDLDTFGLVDGVWVCAWPFAMPLAWAVRQGLVEVARARTAGQDAQTKTELVYAYLTGPRFRARVEAIVEKLTAMNEDLEQERRQMTRMWAKREGQIRGAVDAAAGMAGDLQGISGGELKEIEGLSMKELA